MTKPTQWLCAQQRLRSAWALAWSDQSLRCALSGQLKTQCFFMQTEKTLITRQMPSLIWVFAGRICHFVGFVMRRLIWASMLTTGLLLPIQFFFLEYLRAFYIFNFYVVYMYKDFYVIYLHARADQSRMGSVIAIKWEITSRPTGFLVNFSGWAKNLRAIECLAFDNQFFHGIVFVCCKNGNWNQYNPLSLSQSPIARDQQNYLELSVVRHNKMSCDMTKPTKLPSEDSDQPGHLPSLIRVFAVRSMGSWGPMLSSCGQRKLWSDWANAQDDLSLRWADSHIVSFVMSRLKLLSDDDKKPKS